MKIRIASSTNRARTARWLDAKKAGKIRYIGFTGHKDPHIHLYMLEVARRHGFEFDAVQMPLNVMDAHYRSFEKLVLPELVRHGTGVLGMKPLANGIILKSKTVSAPECLRYALTLPTSVVITGIDSMKILNQACDVASRFSPMSDDEDPVAARKDCEGGRARRIRAVQDVIDLRRHGRASGMAG